MRLLRAMCHPDEERAWPAPSKLVQSMPHEEKTSWRFLAYDDQGKQVWLKAMKYWHMPCQESHTVQRCD
jgi:hypothetical protein